ncbi:hypothetical protein L484_001594 [Morus notabilis]|uniref:C2H2-type domain-containing protein n=1 Tax=Morus notabilis TaxID=981085 RepID=W9R6I8_9ROSA|nr:zinc finger protein 830 [Morus notabilis]XP_024019999.1 zinc finger protein 830 [Morus notabilis]EXB55789.1 hypothetical protein L484_001594 [Morus notabilis]
MDSDSKKALFRAKLKNSKKKEKRRIDSPLVRYNESDEPVCRVCNIVLKSESLWDSHQVSRKHREAISNLKAAAAGLPKGNNAKPEPRKASPESKPEHVEDIQKPRPESSRESPRPQLSSSGLPPDFFDNIGKQNPNSEKNSVQVEVEKHKTPSGRELTQALKITGSEAKQAKGALPEGFFDNKEADLLARGIKPVKPDVKDEYKEFEKLIQEDLQEVDNRFEEEEFDAAEMIEEAESVEQKTYREKVELLRKRKVELKTARSAKQSKGSKEVVKERPSPEKSSSDDDSDENFAVDWRAQHL